MAIAVSLTCPVKPPKSLRTLCLARTRSQRRGHLRGVLGVSEPPRSFAVRLPTSSGLRTDLLGRRAREVGDGLGSCSHTLFVVLSRGGGPALH